jgi:signal transduction histidine kinase
VAVEALRNAFKHARASVIEMELHYDDRELRLRVRDDGCGIDAAVLDSGGRAGHYGLAGMHERADLVRGKLGVWSRLGAGTEVELTIPGAIAYAKSPSVARRAAAEQGT